MDFENFNQCLAYVQTASQAKTTLELLLPYGGALSGVLIGFLINQFREWLRERKILRNKKKCIDEDVHRLRYLLELATQESMKVLNVLAGKGALKGHNLPVGFKTPLIDEYFADTAYTYTVQDRYYLKELGIYTPKFEDLAKRWDLEDSRFKLSIVALEIINTSASCIGMCDQLLRSNDPRADSESLLKSKGFDNSDVLIYEAMSKNAETKNARLQL